jgi:NTE family protein
MNAASFGIPKMFVPRWYSLQPEKNISLLNNNKDKREEEDQQYNQYFDPRSWTYLHDHSPLAKTLDKYIDYKKIFNRQEKRGNFKLESTYLPSRKAILA